MVSFRPGKLARFTLRRFSSSLDGGPMSDSDDGSGPHLMEERK